MRPLKEKRQQEGEPRADPDLAARRAREEPGRKGRGQPFPQQPGEGGTPGPGMLGQASKRMQVQKGAAGGTQNTSQLPTVGGQRSRGRFNTPLLPFHVPRCHPRNPGPVGLAGSPPGSPPGESRTGTAHPSDG